jgi:hypothetical protein
LRGGGMPPFQVGAVNLIWAIWAIRLVHFVHVNIRM